MSETIVFAFFWGIVLFTLAIPSFYVTAYTIFSIPELREIYETALSEVRKARGGSGAVSSVEGLPNHREESVISDPSSGTAGEGEIVEKESLGLVGLRRTLILIISFPMGIIPLFVLMALLQHMMLKLMGYPSRFETTARIGLFATAGIAAAIPPIPILAVLFGFVIYPIALTAIGLRQVYGTGVFKATFLTVTSMILANQMMLQLTAFLQ